MIKHGEFIAPEVVVLGETKRAEPDADGVTGVLQRFSKSKRASDTPTAMASVSAVYADAIQLMEASGSAQMRGLGLMFVVSTVATLVFFAPNLYRGVKDAAELSNFFVTAGWCLIAAFLVFVVRHWLVAAWRLDLFAADEQPTLFDRKHRKVYRLFTPLDGSANTWSKRFKPIELQAVEYEWDGITAEHRAEVVTSGQTVSRIHRLVMVVRDHRKPGEKQGRLLEEFNVGNSMALGENSVPMLWEHIRRFMEERGPGVPDGESMQVFERPKNLWQSMGVVSPFGPRFGWWWRTNRFVTVFFLVIAPFTVPYFTLWAICNWISHMTMRKTVWPQVMHERVGKPIQRHSSNEGSASAASTVAPIDHADADRSLYKGLAYLLAVLGCGCAAYESFALRPVTAIAWGILPLVSVPLAHFINTEAISLQVAKVILVVLAVPAASAAVALLVAEMFL